MKQTAVDWLIEKTMESGHLWVTDKPDDIQILNKLIEQAKEMERQQIVESFNLGTWNGGNNVNFKNGKQYFIQTYGGEK